MEKLVRLGDAELNEFVRGVIYGLAGFGGPEYADFSEDLTVREFGDALEAVEARLLGFDPSTRRDDDDAREPDDVLLRAVRDCVSESPFDLRRLVKEKNSLTPSSDLLHYDWEVNVALGSSECADLRDPLLTLDLTTTSGSVSVELDREELGRVIATLQSAVDAMPD